MVEWNIVISAIFIACAWVLVLTQPDGPFGFIRPWSEGCPAYDDEPEIVPAIKSEWIRKLLYGCEKCIAGQIALWVYVFQNAFSYTIIPFLGGLIATTFSSIILAGFIGKIYTSHKY